MDALSLATHGVVSEKDSQEPALTLATFGVYFIEVTGGGVIVDASGSATGSSSISALVQRLRNVSLSLSGDSTVEATARRVLYAFAEAVGSSAVVVDPLRIRNLNQTFVGGSSVDGSVLRYRYVGAIVSGSSQAIILEGILAEGQATGSSSATARAFVVVSWMRKDGVSSTTERPTKVEIEKELKMLSEEGSVFLIGEEDSEIQLNDEDVIVEIGEGVRIFVDKGEELE